MVEIALPLPVSVGREVEIRIESLGHRGEGVGRYKGFAVFVSGAIPGELVRAEIIGVKKDYARGMLLEVIQPSPHRVEECCAGHRECGGCQLLHISYQEQLRLKRRRIVQTLARLGGLNDIQVKPVLGMDHPWGYRNKAVFHLNRSLNRAGEKFALGFYRERSHMVAEVGSCHIVPDDMIEVASGVREALSGLYAANLDDSAVPVKKSGILRNLTLPGKTREKGNTVLRPGRRPVPVTEVVVRKGFATEELMVILVSDYPEFPEAGELARMIINRFPNVVTVVRQLNRSQSRGAEGAARFRTLIGRGFIRDRIGGLVFDISPASFFQVNPVQLEILGRVAQEYAGLTGGETVIDAYCGTGAFSLFLAGSAYRVFGIEVVGSAVRDARKNAALNGANNVDLSLGLAEQVLPDLAKRGIKADVIILDPPRQGCDRRVLDTVADMAPSRLIYVSCEPGTLARDLGYLNSRGFVVEEVQPVDMFPHTAHVETVVLMSNVKNE